eukprot:9002004-Pyramimonas_sp.AAC.1
MAEERMHALEQQMRAIAQELRFHGRGLVLQPRAESFVDTRALGKPDMFMGEEHKWNDWKEIFKAYCGVVNADLLAGMRLAESADEAS